MAKADSWQQRHRVAAFLFAVQKKFGEDRGGYLAALITFYAFLSIFPLLLAAFTIAAFAVNPSGSCSNFANSAMMPSK